VIITRGIHIAIIDDGVNEGHYNLGDVFYNIEINSRLEILERKNYNKYELSHGTTCAAIIKKYAPDAIISSIKVLNENMVGAIDKLIKAINWCVENNIKILNLSLGTVFTKDMYKLKETINLAYSKGLIIIAACNNRGIITYPASFSNTIGVRSDKQSELKENHYIYNNNTLSGIEIIAVGAHELTDYRSEKEVTLPANSFAAPFITAMIYNILCENQNLNIEQVKEHLACKSINKNKDEYSVINRSINLDWIQNSILINIGLNENLLIGINYFFNVIDIINIVSCDIELINEEIRNYFESHKEVIEKIDTIIIIDNIEITKLYMKQICDDYRKKNIVYIPNRKINCDIIDLFNSIDTNRKLWYPYAITNSNYLENNANIDVPIIFINNYGDMNSIKLISQLRKKFEADGYDVVAVSDMCLGCITNIYYVPLIGIEDNKFVSIIKEINKLNNPDIIIVSIDMNDKLRMINKLLEPDVNIIMKNDKDYLESLINLKSENNLIITDEKKLTYENLRYVKYFNLSEVEKIYEYIIGLYC
jgi:hypothetical protein